MYYNYKNMKSKFLKGMYNVHIYTVGKKPKTVGPFDIERQMRLNYDDVKKIAASVCVHPDDRPLTALSVRKVRE